MWLDLVLLLEYLLWILGRLCRLPSISLIAQVCCWHLVILCHHFAEGNAPLSGCCQVKRPKSASCICKIDFALQEKRANTNPEPYGETSKTELGRAGEGEAVAAASDSLGKGRQLWLMHCMYWVVTAVTLSLPSETGRSSNSTDHLAVLPPSL